MLKLLLSLLENDQVSASPNSVGACITYNPTVGPTDESRNCVSNIRSEGSLIYILQKKSFSLMNR